MGSLVSVGCPSFLHGLCFLGLAVLAYIGVNLVTPDPKPLYGVYAVPGRWFAVKFHLMRLLLSLARRRTTHARRRGKDPALQRQHQQRMDELDTSTEIDDDLFGHNSFYVNGSDQTGSTRLIARVAIRPDGHRDIWFLLRLPGLGDLVLPRHPHCLVTGVQEDGFTGGGLDCSVIEPMKAWRIKYDGPCRVGIRRTWEKEDTRPLVQLRCSFLWTRTTPFYDFATDVHPRLAAYNLAKEKWTGQFFQKLRSIKQVHYEHFGKLEGVVRVGDREEEKITLTGVKDRSLGPRRWSDMRSYILNFIVLENGMCLHIGAFCYPGVVSNLTSGFVIRPTGEVIPAVSVDLPLADLMEKSKDPPMEFTFSMVPEVGEELFVDVVIDDVMHFNMDGDWSVIIREGLSRFTVNGVSGRGVCEVLKRHHGGCPIPDGELKSI